MKIWILNHYAGLPEHVPATRTFDISRRLVNRGHSVTIFASSFSYYKHEEEHLLLGEKFKIEDYNGLKFIWIKTFSYFSNSWKRLLNIVEYAYRTYFIGKSLGTPDIIVGTCVHPFAPLSAYLLAKYYKVPFCYEVTDLWPETLVEMGSIHRLNPVSIMLYWLERKLFYKATRIITLLPYVNEYVYSKGLDGSKVEWIPNGFDRERYMINSDEPVVQEPFIVMYAGGFSEAQGLTTIVEAAKIVQDKGYTDIEYHLLGDGKERTKLMELSNNYNLKNILFPGMIPKDQLHKYLINASVFIACLKNMNLFKYGISPNKLMDYFMAEHPIIFAINSKNNPVADANAGLSIQPEDPESMAKAIVEVYNMSHLERRKMGLNGKKYALANYDFDILSTKYEKTLVSAIKDYDKSRYARR